MSVRIQYAIPARQVFVAIGTVLVTTFVICAAALTLASVEIAMVAAVALIGLMIVGLVKNVAAEGDAALEAEDLVITPVRRSLCAAGGVIRIPWTNIERVQYGASGNGKAFTILRTKTPKRSWILMPKDRQEHQFHQDLLDRTNAARSAEQAAPLQARSPYESRGWRIAAALSVAALVASIAGTLLAGKAADWNVWRRVIVLACFALPFALTVFAARSGR